MRKRREKKPNLLLINCSSRSRNLRESSRRQKLKEIN